MSTTICTTLEGKSRLVHPAEVPCFGSIVIDCPWPERGGGKIKRGADKHYEVMPIWQIIETIIRSPLWNLDRENGAHVWLWVTNNHLANRAVFTVADALGVRPVTMRTWAKDRSGTRQYLAGKTEHMMFCVAGPTRLPDPSSPMVTTLMEAPRSERHSEKPPIGMVGVEQVSPGPRAEIFAREPRPGWYSWGNDPALAAAARTP